MYFQIQGIRLWTDSIKKKHNKMKQKNLQKKPQQQTKPHTSVHTFLIQNMVEMCMSLNTAVLQLLNNLM